MSSFSFWCSTFGLDGVEACCSSMATHKYDGNCMLYCIRIFIISLISCSCLVLNFCAAA